MEYDNIVRLAKLRANKDNEVQCIVKLKCGYHIFTEENYKKLKTDVQILYKAIPDI